MSKNKTKKKKNISDKKANISSKIKKIKATEKSVNNKEKNTNGKKNDVKKTKSDKSNKNHTKKEKNTDLKKDSTIIKASKAVDSGTKETNICNSNAEGTNSHTGKTENNDIGKNIIKQGNKLIFSDTVDETKPEDAKVPDTGRKNSDKDSFFENKLELAVMSKKERRAAKKAAYREYTSTMSGKERVSYFFYCYKWHIIIPICCALLILCYGMAFYRNSRPVALSYAVLNAEEFDKTFHEDYLSYFNMPDNHVMRATAGYFVNYDYYKKNMVSASREGTNYNTLALTCQSGTFDVIIGDGAGIKYCTFVEIVQPLDLYFTEEQYAALESHIVKFQDSSYTFYPYAIDISDTEFAKGLNLGYSKVYIAFPGVSEENMTNSLRLLEYVLGIDLVE